VADDTITGTVERLVAGARPDVEVWHVEHVASEDLVRVLIAHPDGVDVDLCHAVTRALEPLRDRHALEVSSPGLERPLVTDSHFARSVGETIEVRLAAPIDGRKSVRGRLVAADADALRLAVDDAEVVVPRTAITTSNIVWSPVRS
jgi:ribosome maturation factor RimP